MRDARRKIIANIAARCRRSGVECNAALLRSIVPPTHCPVLGTPISFEHGKGRRRPEHTASFERIDPRRGYVEGNVIIISNRANTMKNNATPEELRLFAAWVMAEQADWFDPR